jgi:hypothetical protein
MKNQQINVEYVQTGAFVALQTTLELMQDVFSKDQSAGSGRRGGCESRDL